MDVTVKSETDETLPENALSGDLVQLESLDERSLSLEKSFDNNAGIPNRTFAEIYSCLPDAYSDVDVAVLDLSVRSNNCLHNANCQYISQLLTYSYEKLFKLRNMGRRSVEEIITKLGNYISDNPSLLNTLKNKDNNQYSEQQKAAILAYLYNEPLDIETHGDIENDEIFYKCRQVCELLGKDVCLDAYINPAPYIDICAMFNEAFATQFLQQSIKEQLAASLASVDQSLLKKTVKPFIEAYAISTSKDTNRLQELCHPNAVIERLPQCLEGIHDEQDIITTSIELENFIKWLNYDIEIIKNNVQQAYFKAGERAVNIVSQRVSGKTLQEIADGIGLTKERVRQLETKAIRRFWYAYNNQNYDLLSLVSAIRGGDYVLTFSEIEEELGLEFTKIMWLALCSKAIEIVNYRYDFTLDAVIFNNVTDSLSSGLHMTLMQALDLLPELFSEEELPELLATASDQTGLPLEVIKRKFEQTYSLRGQIYHSTRITIGHMCERVLKERFPNGYKIGELAEQNLFNKYIVEIFGEESKLTNRAIDMRVPDVGVLCDRGRYIHPDYICVDKAILERIDEYIRSCADAEVPFSEIFDVLSQYLLEAKIPNRYYLQGVIKKYRNQYGTSRDCIIKKYNVSTNARPTYIGNPLIQQPHFINEDMDIEKVKEIISTHFKNGYRLSANIDFTNFLNYYSAKYGTSPDFGKDDLDKALFSIAVVFDERAYIYTDDIIDAINECLEELDTPCISIRLFFEQQHGKLYNFGIYSPEMLRAFIERYFYNLSCRNDYIYLQGEVSPTIIVRDVFNEQDVWTFDELYNRLPGLKQDTIRQILNREGYVRIDKGIYTHLDNMNLPDDEGEKIASFIEEQLRERDYITASELDLTLFSQLNPHCSYTVIRDAVFNKFLSHTYCKRSQIITYPQKQQRISDILEKYCNDAETMTVKDLFDFETTLDSESDPHYALPAAYKTMIRVSDELFISDSKVSFDIDKIDEMVSLYCRENFLPLKSVNDLALFPFMGYPWNLYLLESFLMKYSRIFRHDARTVNSGNIGVIVRKKYTYNDYDDILAAALADSEVSLEDKTAAGNYLFENGYIGWKRIGKSENKVLDKAQELRLIKL